MTSKPLRSPTQFCVSCKYKFFELKHFKWETTTLCETPHSCRRRCRRRGLHSDCDANRTQTLTLTANRLGLTRTVSDASESRAEAFLAAYCHQPVQIHFQIVSGRWKLGAFHGLAAITNFPLLAAITNSALSCCGHWMYWFCARGIPLLFQVTTWCTIAPPFPLFWMTHKCR